MPTKKDMDGYADQVRDVLIDDFAQLSKLINERDYAAVSVFLVRLGDSLIHLSEAFAIEAIVRKLEERFGPGLDRPDEV